MKHNVVLLPLLMFQTPNPIDFLKLNFGSDFSDMFMSGKKSGIDHNTNQNRKT